MAYIVKEIVGTHVYWKGKDQWTDKFSERKIFSSVADAEEARTKFSGVVVSE